MGYNASSSSSSLAPGFRFHPTDEELVIYYLKRKVCGKPFHIDAISEIDIYKFEPWDLPDRSRLKTRDLEWYFFSGLDKKYGNGWRTNRATDQGYWKTTGKDRPVKRSQRLVGMKKTLVFHLGRAPHGQRTNWVMHEYRLVDDQSNQPQDAFVLCRVFRKSGPGPKNGEQYGAPFVEEDWDDNDLLPKSELLTDAYCDLANNDYLQMQEEYKENPSLISIPRNEFLVGTNGEDDCHHLKKPGESSEGDKKVSTGSDENVILPDEKMFSLPELFQMDQTPNENEYFSLDEFLNPEDDNHHTDDLVDGELTYLDALQEPAISNGAFVTLDDPNSFNGDKNSFQLLDEYLQYFDDADINSNFVDLKSSAISEAGVTCLNDAVLTVEGVNTQNYQATLGLPEPPQTNCDPGASSSENKLESPKAAADAKYSNGWDNSIAKQVSRMLGSIPAPIAFAAEIPTKDAAFRQNAAARSSSPVHVTAGMIHISDMTVYGSEKMWSLGKSGNVDLLLPYGMTTRGMDLISSSYEATDNTLANKATTVILRSGLYFMFLWVLILSVSCKIGSYIYSR